MSCQEVDNSLTESSYEPKNNTGIKLFSLTLLLYRYEWGVPSPVQHGERHWVRSLLPVNPSAPIAHQEWLLHQVGSVWHLLTADVVMSDCL